MKPHTYRFVFAALLLTMLAVFGIAFTAEQFDSEGGDHMLTSQADIDAWLEGLRKELR